MIFIFPEPCSLITTPPNRIRWECSSWLCHLLHFIYCNLLFSTYFKMCCTCIFFNILILQMKRLRPRQFIYPALPTSKPKFFTIALHCLSIGERHSQVYYMKDLPDKPQRLNRWRFQGGKQGRERESKQFQEGQLPSVNGTAKQLVWDIVSYPSHFSHYGPCSSGV